MNLKLYGEIVPNSARFYRHPWEDGETFTRYFEGENFRDSLKNASKWERLLGSETMRIYAPPITQESKRAFTSDELVQEHGLDALTGDDPPILVVTADSIRRLESKI